VYNSPGTAIQVAPLAAYDSKQCSHYVDAFPSVSAIDCGQRLVTSRVSCCSWTHSSTCEARPTMSLASAQPSRSPERTRSASPTASEDDKPFRCPLDHCQRRFNRKYTLSEHMKTHTGDRPHACRAPGCGRRFATSSNLSRHMRLHGPLPLMRCPRDGCSRAFLSETQLAKHLKQHDAPRTHPCKIAGCTKTFSTTGNLNRHLKKHCTGGRREQLSHSALVSWGAPFGPGKDCRTDQSTLNVDIMPAPIDRPCVEPWSPETLEILGHMLLS